MNPSKIPTVHGCETAIATALEDLRRVQRQAGSNLLASASIEHRIGALRRRKSVLEQAAPDQAFKIGARA